MKNANIFSALLVSFLVVGFQGALAQNTGDALDRDAEQIRHHKKLAAQKTQALISEIVPSKRARILQTGENDELFLINSGKPAINIMKDESNPDQTEFWYLVVSDKTIEVEEDMVIENADPGFAGSVFAEPELSKSIQPIHNHQIPASCKERRSSSENRPESL